MIQKEPPFFRWLLTSRVYILYTSMKTTSMDTLIYTMVNGYIYIHLDILGKLEVWRWKRNNLQKYQIPEFCGVKMCWRVFRTTFDVYLFRDRMKGEFFSLFGQLNWDATGYTNIQQTFHTYTLGFSCILPNIIKYFCFVFLCSRL